MPPGHSCSRTLSITCLLAASLCAFTSAAAQQNDCSLDARNRPNAALPQIGAEAMPPALAAEIRSGFDLISIRNAGTQGEQLLRHAQSVADATGNTCGQALALFGLAEAARTSNLTQALPLFRRSEKLLQTSGTPMALAHVHERIATTQHLLGDNDAFLREDPAVQQEFHDAGDEGRAIMEKSLFLQYAGTGQKPDEQKALLEQLKSVDAPNVTAVRGFVEWETGSSLRRTGRYAEIAGYMHASLTDLTACDCQPITRAAVLLTFAAAADGGGDAATVMDYARQADAVYRKYHLDTYRPSALRLIAASYAHAADWPHAIATYELAARMARERGAVAILATTGMELADAYGKSGQPLKGLATLRDTAPATPTPSNQCDIHAERMSLEIEARLYPEAEADGQAAFTGCHDLLQPATLALLHTQYAGMEMQRNRWEQAYPHAREAVAIVDTQRLRAQTTDRALRTFNEQKTSAYNTLVASLVQLHRPQDALLASEQFRARAFLDLANSRAPEDSSAGKPSTARGAPALKSEAHPFALTADEIRESLKRQNSTLVSFWLGQDGHLTTWVMSSDKPVFQTDRKIDPVHLAALIRATEPSDSVGTRGGHAVRVATRGGGRQTVATVSRQPWRDLYTLLIAPIAAQLPQDAGSVLTIVPYGQLFQLSFPALLDPQDHYLVERYAVHTVPSAGVLSVTAENDRVASTLPANYLLVANPSNYPDVDGHALPQLPGTDAEVRSISHQLEGKTVTLLEGRKAGIDTLVETLPQATVLHFATHAVVSDTAPLTSFLALDRNQHGGLLTAGTVYGLHMNASLVVLSACSTGRGQISGDGVAGLSRAFFYAGAASLVTTLWDVVDEPTAQLMPRFYAGLVKGETRSAALREAQLALIDDLRHQRVHVKTLAGTTISLPEQPAYWAAFSLSGQP